MNSLQTGLRTVEEFVEFLKGAWIDFNTALRTVEKLDLNLKYIKGVNSSIKHSNVMFTTSLTFFGGTNMLWFKGTEKIFVISCEQLNGHSW